MIKGKFHIISVHLAVMLFGFAGLFGKLINQPAMIIVWGRVIFAAAALAAVLKISGSTLKIVRKTDKILIVLLGALLATHWWSFFYSIQISSVVIGLISYATFPAFTAVIEPIFFNEKFSIKLFLISGLTFAAVSLIALDYEIGSDVFFGILWGLFSAVTFSLLTIFNRKLVTRISSISVAFYQSGLAAVFLTPLLLFENITFNTEDALLLLLLGTVFTALAHTLFIKSLEKIKAQTAGIIASLEPVYGIVAAVILLGAYPGQNEIIGGSVIIILAAIVSGMKKN